ncbi:hypothetical protein ACJIZ3_017143 [Penstemon smallii]|uniref:GATA-type domain-containing protein n=1 Tax=Penstemon smallii TaxID=265156 RepID=A0ABD3SVG0_9LAMI
MALGSFLHGRVWPLRNPSVVVKRWGYFRNGFMFALTELTQGFEHFVTESWLLLFQDNVEEELEWISNKDAFPSVDTCFSILPESPELKLNHLSPISVLENSSNSSNNSNTNSNGSIVVSCCDNLKVATNHPVRARSMKRRRKRTDFVDLPCQKTSPSTRPLPKIPTSGDGIGRPLPEIPTSGDGMGRRCLHCQVDKTPQWRAGPMGPKTLCNACGVRYKSGRLFPEYRPANSPTFSSALHSNSHRKVVEMRKQKQVGL